MNASPIGRPPRDDAHRRQARRHDRASSQEPLHNQRRRHRAGAAAEHVREAFAKAAPYKPKLTRYERQQILMKTAELLVRRQGTDRRPDHRWSRPLLKDSLYEVGRAYDVYQRWRASSRSSDDGQIFSCDISPHGKARASSHAARAGAGAISAITPFNHPLNHGRAQGGAAIATNNRVVLKPTELTPLTALLLADVLYEAGLPPEMLRSSPAPAEIGDAMITDPARRPRHLHRRRCASASTSPRRPAIARSCWNWAATIR
jgi:acyl-CoA reductase-like NAD-dependent aldehyde dehydrogenase